jgi:hypothetical protein
LTAALKSQITVGADVLFGRTSTTSRGCDEGDAGDAWANRV